MLLTEGRSRSKSVVLLRLVSRPLFVVLTVSQLVSWGTLYYGFAVFVGPMRQWPAWSPEFISAGPSLALLTWGLSAPVIGRLLDARGARDVMSTGSLLAGAGLLLWGMFPASKGAFLAAWIFIGCAMAAVLYEPAFAILVQRFPVQYKAAIGLLTVAAGIAGTIFIPIIHAVVEKLGWTTAVLGMAALHLLVLMPMHAITLPAHPRTTVNEKRDRPAAAGLFRHPEFRLRTFVGLSIWFGSASAATASITFLGIPVFLALGAGENVVIASIAAIGVAQLISRAVSLRWLTVETTTLSVGRFAALGIPAAMLVVILFRPTPVVLLLFAAIYGSAKGLTTIVRGTSIAETMDRALYARCSGWLATSSMIMKAGTPFLMAVVWSRVGDAGVVLWITLAVSLFAPVGLWLVQADQRARFSTFNSTTRPHSSVAHRR